MEIAPTIVFVGLLVFFAHLFIALFERTKIPDVFFLILIGLFLGPILKIVAPQDFGKVGMILTTIALVVILFESGIGLDFETLKDSVKTAMSLTGINFVTTAIVVSLIAWCITPLSYLMSLILGTIVGGTSSAVVIPMIQNLKLEKESRTVLLLESVISDVLCIIFTLALVESFKYQELRIGLMVGQMVASFVLAVVLGVMSAIIWSFVLRKVRQMQNSILTTPAFVVVLYGVTEILGYSGAISALAFGFTLGHIDFFNFSLIRRFTELTPVHLNEIEKSFFSEIVFLLKTFFFVYVGISIPLTSIWLVIFGIVLTLVIFVLRIPVVRLSIPISYSKKDASIMAVMVPKGLAAAVLAGLPLQFNMPGGDLIQNVVYAVVLFTIVLCTIMVFLLQKSSVSQFYLKLFPKHPSEVDLT